MGSVSVLYIAFASISLFACILQLFLSYIKRIDLRTLTSAILSFAIFVRYSLVFLCLDPLGLTDHPLTLLRCQLILDQVVTVCMLGMVFYLLSNTRKFILILYISVLSFLIILSLIIPDNLFFGNNEGVHLSNQHRIDYLPLLGNGFTWWRAIIDLTFILFTLFIILILIKRSDPFSLRTNKIFYTGLGVIILAAFYDQMVDLGQINSAYLLPFAVFVFYLILSFIPYLFLLREVIEKDEISEQEEKWRRLVMESEVIVVGLNRMGNVEFINPYFYNLSGYREDEVIGKDWFEFFLPREQYYEVQGAFIEIFESEFHPHYINPILTKNKEQRMIRWFNVRNRDKNGTINGSISIGVDVTEDIREKENMIKKLGDAEALIEKLKSRGYET